MLYQSLSQPLVFLCIFCTGIASGLLFDCKKLLVALCNKNKVFDQVLGFICVSISALGLFLTNLGINYGRFRLYILLAFALSFTLERFSIGKLWTKIIDVCYNKVKERQKRYGGTKK